MSCNTIHERCNVILVSYNAIDECCNAIRELTVARKASLAPALALCQGVTVGKLLESA
jgi:hypothetical protein